MASKAQTESKASPGSRNRDLAYRSSQDVSGPLTAILAVIAFVLLASFVYNLDWRNLPDLPDLPNLPASPGTSPPAAPATPQPNS